MKSSIYKIHLNIGGKLSLMIAIASFFVLSAIGLILYLSTSNMMKMQVKSSLLNQTVAISNQLDAYFNRILQMPTDVAAINSTLVHQPDHENQVKAYMQAIVQKDKEVLNLYSAFEEGLLPQDECPLWVWVFDENHQKVELYEEFNYPGCQGYDPSQPIYDFTNDPAWYLAAKQAGKPVWGPPYFDQGGMNQYIISAVAPIFDDRGSFVGVSGTDVALEHLTEVVAQVKVGKTGYAFVLGPQGEFVAAPSHPQWVTDKFSLFDLAEDSNSEEVKALGNAMTALEQKIFEMSDPLNKKSAWIAVTPIHSVGFSLAVVLPSDEAMAQVNQLSTRVILISLLGILAMVGIAFGVARTLTRPLNEITHAAGLLSVGEIGKLNNIEQNDTKDANGRTDEIYRIKQAFSNLVAYFKEVTLAAQRIADGDLTVNVAPKTDGDLLGIAFASMVTNLRQLIGQVANNTGDLSIASVQLASAAEQAGQATSQIATTIQQVAQGAAQQSESVTRTAASVEQLERAIDGVAKGAQEQAKAVSKAAAITNQIATAIQQVAQNSQTAAAETADAAEAARQGNQTVERTIHGMRQIQTKVRLSAQKVEDMGQRSSQIGTILETIEDIASQTNLLALNAAIEAARAGEHGKGFAVVADEVRKLAERAATATKEIGELVNVIQSTVAEAVTAMEEGSKEVESGVEMANEAGEALSSILKAVESVHGQAEQTLAVVQKMNAASSELVEAMDTVSAVVEENTSATEEMAASSNQVTQAIENIASVSEENSAAIEEVSAAAEQMSAQVEEVSASTRSLEEMAQNLTLAVLQFRLSETQSMDKLIDVFKIAHLQWVKKLREMLDGKHKLQENQVTNHTECKFGQWYYGRAAEGLKGLPEFIAVERPHAQLHEFARKAVRAFHQGDRRAAENYTKEVESLSHEIASALDALKRKISASAVQEATSEYTPTNISTQSKTRPDAVKVAA